MNCKKTWTSKRLLEIIDFNPKETLRKGQRAKKIAMEQLRPFSKTPMGYCEEFYNGGAKFKNGDTLLARITPCLENGKTAQVNELEEGEVGFGSTEYIVLRAKEGKSDKDFIYYLSISPNFRSIAIKSMVGSSGRQRVQQNVLENAEFLLPDLKTQKKISAVLGSLDNKIELNEKINQNLEAQAQAIFKSWFVDFEPFGGKMPADWKSGTFSELITNTVGGDWGKDELQDNYTEEVYCIRGADIPDVKIGNRGKMPKRYILQKNYSLKKLNDGDLVVEISGGSPTQSTGRIAAISDYLLNKYKNKIICTNFCKSLKPKKNYSEYVYHYWQYLYDKNIFFGYENGTTGIKNLDISAFLETEPVIIPSQNILVAFAEVCKKTFAQIYHNGYENETLAQLRDTLLPKLMSGEIDVSDVAV